MKQSTNLLRETLQKRDELYTIPYWHRQIPDKCPPILWFGDHRRTPKIVTVGLNPSYREFFKTQDDARSLQYYPSSKRRFYVYSTIDVNNSMSPESTNRVIPSYDEYFKRNPYTKWFGRPRGYNIECFINQLDASFYHERSFSCVHIDLFPYATIDKFSDLDQSKMNDIFKDSWFLDHFKDLVDFLDPKDLIMFGRSTTEYFNKYFEGTINLNSHFSKNGRKYASYGVSVYTVSGKQVPLVGLSVNLGNPRGFTKELLAGMGREVQQKLNDTPQTWRTLPFLECPINNELLDLALQHEKNHELAQVGDAVLRLAIREHYYNEQASAKVIQGKDGTLGDNDYLASVALNKLNLKDYVRSLSGLEKNPNINKVYADTLEAIIGAIYKEHGMNSAKEFVKKWLIPSNGSNKN